MRTLAAALALFVCTTSSSACLFPCFPTYSAGYYGWGNRCGYPAYAAYPGYGFGYRSAYGYAPAYGVSYGGYPGGCANGSCGTTYSAGYLGYSNSCCNPCGVSSCGGCGTGCAANCIATDRVITDPTPDPLSDNKTYADPDRDRDSDPGYDRDLDRGFGRDRSTDPLPGGGTSRPEQPDDFGSSDPDWIRRRTDPDPLEGGTGSEMFGTESRKPPMEEPREFGAPAGADPDGADPDGGAGEPPIIDRSASKPAVSDPLMEEQTGESETNTPTGEESDEDPPAPAPPSAAGEGAEGADEDTEDVLGPETPVSVSPRTRMIFASQTATRSRLHDVVRPGFARRLPVTPTQLSASDKKQQRTRWMSAPLPAGRVRL